MSFDDKSEIKHRGQQTHLHGQSIAGMAASVDDVEGRHRQDLQAIDP